MESVQIKYDNFKAFLREAAPQGSFWLTILASVPLDTFLRSIHEHLEAEPGLTIEQITDKVLLQVGLQKKDFTTAQIEKFSLYCEYFMTVSRCIQRAR